MRFIQAILLLIFLAVLGLFAVQNTEAITVVFGNLEATTPVAILAIGAYLLGMVSGWTAVFRKEFAAQGSECPADEALFVAEMMTGMTVRADGG